MKATAVIVLLLASPGVKAQQNVDSSLFNHPLKHQRSAGDELIVSSDHFYTGITLEAVGTLVNLVAIADALRGTATGSSSGTSGLLLAGTLLDIAGGFFIIESRSHIRRAGIILNKNGVGLSIPVGR